ncbi:response regulator transcription factor [Streptomyces sp. NPDC088729]|uniref:response regulator transcription factor n=1 Tax=unclassified Streptomyces TaxID=2593676 RepID=UPI000F5519CA|nr:response regulator transcription factor [Streptomyces sp. ADI96-02]
MIVEDDEKVREGIADGLRALRHEVVTCGTGSEGLGMAMTRNPDFILLDLGLPDLDGLDVLKMLRTTLTTPVLITSGRDADAQIVRGLGLGADDYLVKPFTVSVLNARMMAVTRRCRQASEQEELRIGGLVVDPRGHTAELDGRVLPLRPKEFRILAYLVENAGRVVSKSELRAEIWEDEMSCADKTLAVHLSWLRRHLGETAAAPAYLHTVRGVGIKVVNPGR